MKGNAVTCHLGPEQKVTWPGQKVQREPSRRLPGFYYGRKWPREARMIIKWIGLEKKWVHSPDGNWKVTRFGQKVALPEQKCTYLDRKLG